MKKVVKVLADVASAYFTLIVGGVALAAGLRATYAGAWYLVVIGLHSPLQIFQILFDWQDGQWAGWCFAGLGLFAWAAGTALAQVLIRGICVLTAPPENSGPKEF